jgi:hypothetical protein
MPRWFSRRGRRGGPLRRRPVQRCRCREHLQRTCGLGLCVSVALEQHLAVGPQHLRLQRPEPAVVEQRRDRTGAQRGGGLLDRRHRTGWSRRGWSRCRSHGSDQRCGRRRPCAERDGASPEQREGSNRSSDEPPRAVPAEKRTDAASSVRRRTRARRSIRSRERSGQVVLARFAGHGVPHATMLPGAATAVAVHSPG